VVLSPVDVTLSLYLDINGELAGTFDVAAGFAIEFSNDASVQLPTPALFHAWDAYFNVVPDPANLSLYFVSVDSFSMVNTNATAVQFPGRCTFEHVVDGSSYFGIVSSTEEQIRIWEDVQDIPGFIPLFLLASIAVALAILRRRMKVSR
jgi:hypothetical protein